MTTFIHDLRYALRMLLKKPGFTAIAIITLGLGIGANTAIFSVVNTVLLRPLPFQDPDHIVHVFRMQPPIERAPISRADYLEWQAQNQVFQYLAANYGQTYNLTGIDEAERLRGSRVTEDFFAIFGGSAAQGRFLLPADNQPGSARVAVISYGLWQRRFGSNPQIVGQTISLNGEPYEVVGVAPARFAYPGRTEIWTPALIPEDKNQRGSNYLQVIARLKEGVSVAQAEAQMNQIAATLAQQFPASDTNLTVMVTPMLDHQVRGIRSVLFVLLGAVVFVLLIACANVANLLLARATARQKEIAIRTAMGASRWRIIRQLLTESVILAILGGALGVLLAVWAVDLLVALAPANLPRAREISVDKWVLGFTFVMSLVTGILFGLAPAWQVSKTDLNETLKESGRGAATGGLHRTRLRRLLVVVEIALSLVLLVSAGLLIQSIQRVTRVDPGFNPQPLLTADVSFPRRVVAKDATAKAAAVQEPVRFLTDVQQRLAALPGVVAVGAINDLPITGRSGVNGDFSVVGQPAPEPGQAPVAEFRLVTPDYFRAMGLALRKGRVFTEHDDAQNPQVILINEALARSTFGDEDPLGKQLNALGDKPSEIIGVVSDARQWGLDRPPSAEIYFPYAQTNFSSETSLVVRASVAPASLTDGVRRVLREANPDAPVVRIKPMMDVLADSVADRRFNMILMAMFAGVALVMAAIGLYGVMSFSVTQRTHEIGIRMALGARPQDVLRLVVRQGMVLAAIGVGIGLIVATALTRVLSSLLYGVSATDPITFTVVSLLLAGVALGACFVPARRATKVDPMVALRYE